MTGHRAQTIVSRLLQVAEENGDALAFTELDAKGEPVSRLTYHELAQEVTRRSAGLLERGLAGERVVVALHNGLEFVKTFFACLHAGAIPVVVEPPRRRQSHQHLHSVVADCGPKLLIADSELRVGLEWTTPERMSADPVQNYDAARDGLAYLQYTSGSTSNPKGATVTHSNILANNLLMRKLKKQSDGITLVSWLPVHHDMGLVSKVLQSVHLAAHCVLMRPSAFLWKPSIWLRAISDYRAHTSGAPNFAFDLAFRKIPEEECAGLELSCWKTAFCAAEPVRMQTIEAFCKRFSAHGFRRESFKPAYGLAEFTLCATLLESPTATPSLTLDRDKLADGLVEESPNGANFVNCGVTDSTTELVIRDPESNDVLPPNRVGEITLSGPSRTPGYWKREPEGDFLRTGDLGFVRDGELFVVGRKKDLVIIAGRNIHPEDVEATVEASHPSLNQGCAAAYSIDDGYNEHLVVAIEMRRGSRAEIEQAVRKSVNRDHQVALSGIVFLKPGQLPRTSSGKIRRALCAKELPLPDLQVIEETEGSTAEHPVEQFLCRKMSSLAGRSGIEPTVRFEDVGLSSVDRFSMMGDLAAAIGIPVPGDATWLYGSPRELAEALDLGMTAGVQLFHAGEAGPVVLVSAITGGTTWARKLVPLFDKTFTLLGLRQGTEIFDSLEAMATHHAGLLLERFGQGPYTLVGYSEFVRLALEVARQLEKRGARVDMVVAMEGSVKDWKQMPLKEMWRQFWTRLLWQALEVLRSKGLPGIWLGLKGAAINFRKIATARVKGGGIPNIFDPESEDVQQRTSHHNLELCNKYQPKPFNGEVVVYRVPNNKFSVLFEPDAGWGEVARGGVEIVDLEGTHTSILGPPTIEWLARDIARRIKG